MIGCLVAGVGFLLIPGCGTGSRGQSTLTPPSEIGPDTVSIEFCEM